MNHIYLKEAKNRKHTLEAFDFKGDIRYYVNGKWGRIDDIVTVYDHKGDTIYQAKQTLLSLFPKFDLTADGKHIANISKHTHFLFPDDPYFTISNFNWKIAAKSNSLDFQIIHDGSTIGMIQKHLNHGQKVYTIALNNNQDMPLAVLMTIIVDHYGETPEKEASAIRFISVNGMHYVQLPRSNYFNFSQSLEHSEKHIHS